MILIRAAASVRMSRSLAKNRLFPFARDSGCRWAFTGILRGQRYDGVKREVCAVTKGVA